MNTNTEVRKQRRAFRTRRRIKRPVDNGRLRLSVFRSAKHIYAQVIDADKGHTVAEANSKSLELSGNKTEQATAVGKALAERASQAGVNGLYSTEERTATTGASRRSLRVPVKEGSSFRNSCCASNSV